MLHLNGKGNSLVMLVLNLSKYQNAPIRLDVGIFFCEGGKLRPLIVALDDAHKLRELDGLDVFEVVAQVRQLEA